MLPFSQQLLLLENSRPSQEHNMENLKKARDPPKTGRKPRERDLYKLYKERGHRRESTHISTDFSMSMLEYVDFSMSMPPMKKKLKPEKDKGGKRRAGNRVLHNVDEEHQSEKLSSWSRELRGSNSKIAGDERETSKVQLVPLSDPEKNTHHEHSIAWLMTFPK